jgi:hypothetical protein
METLFYLFTQIFIIWEYGVLSGRIIVVDEEDPDGPGEYVWFYFMYFIWTFIGVSIYKDQSALFLIFIIFSLIPKKRKSWIKIDAVISIIILLLIFFNHCHFEKPARIQDAVGYIFGTPETIKSSKDIIV